jgi:hypothetical protein
MTPSLHNAQCRPFVEQEKHSTKFSVKYLPPLLACLMSIRSNNFLVILKGKKNKLW